MLYRWKTAAPIVLVLGLLAGCSDESVVPNAELAAPKIVFEYEHPFPVADLYAIWGIASDDIYAVGSYGEILHFDGLEWASMSSPARWVLLDVWGVNADNIVAVGVGGLILRFDGTSWRQEASNTDLWLHGVWGCAPDTFYVVGRSGKVLRYNNVAWETIPIPTDEDLLAIWGLNGHNIYVGARNALLHFDGQNWTEAGIQVRVRVIGIWGSSANDVWVSDGTNWLWHYNGTEWENVRTKVLHPFTNFWGFAPNDVFGVGEDGMVSHFGGSEWILRETFGDYFFLEDIWGSANTDLWVCGAEVPMSGVLTHFDGTKWKRAGSSLAERQLRDIWSDPTGEQACAVGGNKILQKQNGEWAAVPVTPRSPLHAVWGAPSGEVFAVGENSLCLRSDGSEWRDVGPDQMTLNFDRVWGTTKENVYVGAQNSLWRFDGNSWETVLADGSVKDVWGLDESHVFAAGFDTLLHGVVRRFDGNVWETVYDDSTRLVWALAGIESNNILIHVVELDPGRSFLLRYDGAEWRDVTPSRISSFRAICGNAQIGFVVSGHHVQDNAVTNQSLMRLTNDRWELLQPRYGSSFRGMWGGLDGGMYLVDDNEIVRCVLK